MGSLGPIEGTMLHRIMMLYSDGEDESNMIDMISESDESE